MSCGVSWYDKVVVNAQGCNGRHFCGADGEHEVHCCSGCDDLFMEERESDS